MVIIIILLIAAALRFYGLNWDQGQHFHPDERMITIVADKINFKDLNPHFFAYGSFPIYLLKITGSIVGIFDPQYANYQSLNLVGRFLSALFDLGIIVILYLLGKKIFSKKMGLLAAFFYTVAVLPIQLAHFYAVDTPLTFFILLTLYFLIQFLDHHKLKWSILVGSAFGFSLATKTSAILLIVPLGLTVLLKFSPRKIPLIALIFPITLTTFLVLEPFAFLDFPTFLKQTLEQQEMTKSAFTFPYTLQYVDKTPYFYELKNIFFWGLGPLLAILAFLGTLLFTFRTLRFPHNTYYIILTTFFWLYLLVVGKFAIGFMRYMLPLYPLFCLFAAFFLQQLKLLKQLRFPLLILFLIWPLSFLSIYSQPNTRNQASEWIYQNIPPGSIIAREHWDDGLPIHIAAQSVAGGPAGNQVFYQFLELPLYDPDTYLKWTQINQILSQTDYIILASNRLYTPLMKLTNCPKLPPGKCYLQTADYYQKLFDGSLGFSKVAEFETLPIFKIWILKFKIDDSLADESFTVYDHPKVMIFAKDPAKLQTQ